MLFRRNILSQSFAVINTNFLLIKFLRIEEPSTSTPQSSVVSLACFQHNETRAINSNNVVEETRNLHALKNLITEN